MQYRVPFESGRLCPRCVPSTETASPGSKATRKQGPSPSRLHQDSTKTPQESTEADRPQASARMAPSLYRTYPFIYRAWPSRLRQRHKLPGAAPMVHLWHTYGTPMVHLWCQCRGCGPRRPVSLLGPWAMLPSWAMAMLPSWAMLRWPAVRYGAFDMAPRAVGQHAHVRPDDLLVPVPRARGTLFCKLALRRGAAGEPEGSRRLLCAPPRYTQRPGSPL